MNLTDAIAALRPLQAHHSSDSGVHIGFFMPEATEVLGSLSRATNILTELMVQGLVVSEPVVKDGEVRTIFRIAEVTPPQSLAVH